MLLTIPKHAHWRSQLILKCIWLQDRWSIFHILIIPCEPSFGGRDYFTLSRNPLCQFCVIPPQVFALNCLDLLNSFWLSRFFMRSILILESQFFVSYPLISSSLPLKFLSLLNVVVIIAIIVKQSNSHPETKNMTQFNRPVWLTLMRL